VRKLSAVAVVGLLYSGMGTAWPPSVVLTLTSGEAVTITSKVDEETSLGPGVGWGGDREGCRRPSVPLPVPEGWFDTLNWSMSHIRGMLRWIFEGTQSSRSTMSVPEAMRVRLSSFWLCRCERY
jgi:hypothetical protein